MKGTYLLKRGNLMSYNSKKSAFNFELWGWILFIVCAVFSMASGIKNRDILGLTASIIFLIACIIFIMSIIVNKDSTKNKNA
jgi:cbb3-type cytochrome oxidase subunit 1